MGILVFGLLILAMIGHSDASWCICRSDLNDAALQKTLDYACGAGADCTPILSNGPCFQPNNVKAHCSYAVNSFFQKKGQAPGTCVFSNTATISQTDPSPASTCVFPSTASSTGTGTTPSTTNTPSTNTATPSTFTPNTPTTVMGGGINTGLGPSGTGINTDTSNGYYILQKSNLCSLLLTLWFSGLIFLLG